MISKASITLCFSFNDLSAPLLKLLTIRIVICRSVASRILGIIALVCIYWQASRSTTFCRLP
jgi:hypothetical protein